MKGDKVEANGGHANEAFELEDPPPYSSFSEKAGSQPKWTSPAIARADEGGAAAAAADDDQLGKQLASGEAPASSGADEAEAGGQQKGRQQWNNQVEFLLSCIAMSVGLGNIWRFPFTAYENGGGAFLIPYLVVLFLIGKPLYFLELAMGQFSSFGSVKVWAVVPAVRGVGYGQMLGAASTVSYYCNLMGICLLYLFFSFRKVLPWTTCDSSWTQECYSVADNTSLADHEGASSSAELFYSQEILHVYPADVGINDGLGAPDWRLVVCLLIAWISITFTLIKGVQSSGKVAYFSALFPYVVLFTLLIRGATLPGAKEGIIYFVKPDWVRLKDPGVWYAAVTQSFFSLSVGFGSIIMYSSYNPFTHNVYRDAMIISIMDTATSILAGLSIFAIIGNLAHESGGDISQVVKSGAGLAFISYPEAIAKFDVVPQLFAVIFFLMLFTLGLGSATALIGSVITIINDEFPTWKRTHVTLAVSVISFLVGIIYTTPGGLYIQTIVDHFGAGFLIFILATIEIYSMAMIYGVGNFCTDIEFMMGQYPGWYWRLCWYLVTPALLTIILIYSLIELKNPTVDTYEFQTGALAAGWMLSAVGIAIVPILLGTLYYRKKKAGAKEPFKAIFWYTDEWGPKDPVVRRAWLEFRKEKSYRDKRYFGIIPVFPMK